MKINQILNKKIDLSKALVFVLSVQYSIFFIYLASIRSASDNIFFLNYSRDWLLVLVFIFLITLAILLMNFPKFSNNLHQFLLKLSSSSFSIFLQIIFAVLFLGFFIFASLPIEVLSPDFLPYYERFYPIIILGGLTSLEVFITLQLIHRGFVIETAWLKNRSVQFSIILIATSLVILLFVSLSGLGLKPDPVSWRKPGSPIMIWQFAGSILAALLIRKIEIQFIKPIFRKYFDISIIILLIVFAAVSWLSLPLQTAYTSPRIRPPNFEVYPYSDALFYSLSAESVINGNGLFGWSIVPRPLFITGLAYIFGLVNGDYQGVINLQSLILTLIPVCLYLIGKELHGRSLGIALALLSIFREVSAIFSTPFIPVSNTKLILSDLPTLLIYLLLSLVMIKWVKSNHSSGIFPFIMGGGLGIAMLFRTQSILLLPFLLIVLWIKEKKKGVKTITNQFLLMVFALVITISPWLIRNYSLTHELIFDDNRQTEWVMGRYEDGSEDLQENQVETTDHSIVQTILKNPGFVSQFIANHFFRNIVCTLLVIPPTLKSNDLEHLFNSTNWWADTKISLTNLEFGWLILSVILIGFGISKLMKKDFLAGISPIIIFVAYNLSNSLARNSGGRYNLPIDWIGYTYLSAGILIVLMFTLGLRGTNPEEQYPAIDRPKIFLWKKPYLFLSMIFLLVGGSISITENLYTLKNYSKDTPVIGQISDPAVAEIASSLLEDPGNVVITGKAYYPRFYPANEGEPGSSWVAYSPQGFDKLGFILMNENGKTDVIYVTNNRPRVFPNRSNVIVIGNYQEFLVRGKPQTYFDVRLLIFPDTNPLLYYPSSGK